MNYLALPISAVAPSPFKLGLLLNGVIGHALFVGLPIAWLADSKYSMKSGRGANTSISSQKEKLKRS